MHEAVRRRYCPCSGLCHRAPNPCSLSCVDHHPGDPDPLFVAGDEPTTSRHAPRLDVMLAIAGVVIGVCVVILAALEGRP